jgi:hypothetical protein
MRSDPSAEVFALPNLGVSRPPRDARNQLPITNHQSLITDYSLHVISLRQPPAEEPGRETECEDGNDCHGPGVIQNLERWHIL